ncbi:uncharacterized protein LOC131243608 [Magnolia sinica]|uniref:uncharacterized protein LOC131243608 n=1 Tax=Magnolia sinica TaxID=86752 RepID=UPI00265AC30E|nr:uncharacterized protein LOC131243608 [Magnolia sinica]
MEGMASVRMFQQSIEELKHALFSTTMELQSTQLAAKEERRKNEETVKQLLELLKSTFQERDEAKDQLQKLLSKIGQSIPTELFHTLPTLHPESPPARPTIGNSSITDSDSLSGTHNRQSLVSSPVDSFFDAVSSPDLPNMNMADSSNVGILHPHLPLEYNCSSSGAAQIDPASAIIDRLALRKPLPQKGRLLQAVMEAGPLLQTLLVAGPLPQWRIPPPVQPFQVPLVSVNGASQPCSASMLDFSSTVGSCMKKRLATSCSFSEDFVHDFCRKGKCQKFQ